MQILLFAYAKDTLYTKNVNKNFREKQLFLRNNWFEMIVCIILIKCFIFY